jgi:HlyD family secretion protein
MLKKIFAWMFGLGLVLAIGGAFFYLYKKSQAKPIIYQTEQAEVTDLIKKTVATGSVVPRQSVDVKPKVTGVLTQLFKEPGNVVKIGDPIAKVDIIPDAQNLNAAEAQVRSAQITLENAKRELEREEGLFKQGVVAEAEVYKFRTDFALAKQQVETASSNLTLVREGSLHGGKFSNVIVTSTVDGTVIDVPVKVGYSVIQANSFNPGTSVATIANMSDIIFDGRVDESEVAKIREKMKLEIKIGAIDKERFEGELEYIAQQGKEIDGAIQFEIKAKLFPKAGLIIRAGYSANADIVLDSKKQVLAIREALVQYDPAGKPFVDVETSPQTFVRHDVELGLSDGIKVEIVKGVAKGDAIKVPDTAGPAKLGSGSGAGSGSGSAAGGKNTQG